VRWLHYLAIVNGAIVLGLLCSALLGDDGIVRHERLSEELRRIRSINEDFQEKNIRLHAEAIALRTNDHYVESVIRDELGWVRADDVVVIVPAETSAEAPTSPAETSAEAPTSPAETSAEASTSPPSEQKSSP
jgi:cell division protein FtsB